MTVRLTSTAARQLAGILAYIHERNPDGAIRVMERMRRVMAVLDVYPSAGEETDRVGQRRLVLGPYPYLVFYRVRNGEVLIQRIRHTSRRPS